MGEDDTPEAHRPFADMAVSHVLGGLDGDEGRVFRSHLLECSDCRARVGELRAIASDLAGVERDERRERSAKAVETKRRDDEEIDEQAGRTRQGLSRWVLIGLVGVIVCLVAYSIVLRGNAERLQAALDDRLDASAALEQGEEMAVRFSAPGITATAKVDGERLVLLMDGLEDETGYGVYLLDDDAATAQTVYRAALISRQGRVLVPLPLIGTEDRLLVTIPERSMSADPDGRRLLEVDVVPSAPQPAGVGSA